MTSPWLAFTFRRIASTVIVLAFLGSMTFVMVRLIPGDPAVAILGTDVTPEGAAAINHRLGLDEPLPLQFIHYWGRLIQGDFGLSMRSDQRVSDVIKQASRHSIPLAVWSLVVVLLTSVPVGILAADVTRDGRHKTLETAFMSITSVVGALPEFLAATFLAFIFALVLGLLPVAGTDGWQSLVLPCVAVSLRPVAILARIVRVETLSVLTTDYVRTARSKRLPGRLLYFRHVLPNVLTATLAIGGLLFAGLVGGAVVVENVFARPGLGTQLITAVLERDYTVIQGIVLILGVVVVATTAAVDIVLALIDPRSATRES